MANHGWKQIIKKSQRRIKKKNLIWFDLKIRASYFLGESTVDC